MIRPNQPTETLTPEPLYEFSETPITDRDELARLNRTLRRHPPRSANWITWLAVFAALEIGVVLGIFLW